MNPFFSILSVAYIAGIFLLADSPMVSDVTPFNPYSLLHIPLYGILTLLLILSNWSSIFLNRSNPTNSINSTNSLNLSREMRPAPCSVKTSTSGSLFHWGPTNSTNYFFAGMIALAVAIADEIHQSYLPNRNASIIDVFLDIIGIILCMLIIKPIEHMSGFLKLKGLVDRTK